MDIERSLKILKEAYLIEVEGYTFYKNIEKINISNETKELFKFLANEELKHQDYLINQIKNIKSKKIFNNIEFEISNIKEIKNIFLDSIKNITGHFINESSVLYTGILVEKSTFDFYTEASKNAEDKEEIKLFSSLAEWELSHLDILQSAYNIIREKIFTDQQFYPF